MGSMESRGLIPASPASPFSQSSVTTVRFCLKQMGLLLETRPHEIAKPLVESHLLFHI